MINLGRDYHCMGLASTDALLNFIIVRLLLVLPTENSILMTIYLVLRLSQFQLRLLFLSIRKLWITHSITRTKATHHTSVTIGSISWLCIRVRGCWYCTIVVAVMSCAFLPYYNYHMVLTALAWISFRSTIRYHRCLWGNHLKIICVCWRLSGCRECHLS